MKTHLLKIDSDYVLEKLFSNKLFEIRLNDKNFKVGDKVIYHVNDSALLRELFKNRVYVISYITDFKQKDGYVVFGEKDDTSLKIDFDWFRLKRFIESQIGLPFNKENFKYFEKFYIHNFLSSYD